MKTSLCALQVPADAHNEGMVENRREWKKNWVLAERLMEIGITLPAASVLGWLVGA